MKKIIIAVVVGAIILFIWQSVSHMMLGDILHPLDGFPSEQEEAVITALSGAEDGKYMIPAPMPGASLDEHQAAMKAAEGKPWAIIMYHNHLSTDMSGPMIKGFILNLLGVWIIVCMLGYASAGLNSYFKRWWAVFLFGLFLVVMEHLMGWNWWSIPVNITIGESVNTLIMFSLLGLWLAWYLGKGEGSKPVAQ